MSQPRSESPFEPGKGKMKSLLEYFSSKKKETSQVQKPITKNPFFDSKDPTTSNSFQKTKQSSKLTNRSKSNDSSTRGNNIFYNKDSYSSQLSKRRSSNQFSQNSKRKVSHDYVVNNFININKVNISNYYSPTDALTRNNRGKSRSLFLTS